MSYKLENIQATLGQSYTWHDQVMCEYYDDCPPNDLSQPESGSEEERLVQAMRQALQKRRVLEVACGAGWASRHVAQVSESVVATDVSPKRLALARKLGRVVPNLHVIKADAYGLDKVEGSFDGGLAIAWFAHVPRARHREFLDGLHRRVGSGGKVFLADEMYNLGIARDGGSDYYEIRRLEGGETFEIIDNKFDHCDLKQIFSAEGRDLEVHVGRDYWWVQYTIA